MTAAPTMSPYLTVIPDRSPRQKAHESLGQAKKAIIFRARRRTGLPGTSMIYEWVDGKGWEILHMMSAGTKKDELPWM